MASRTRIRREKVNGEEEEEEAKAKGSLVIN